VTAQPSLHPNEPRSPDLSNVERRVLAGNTSAPTGGPVSGACATTGGGVTVWRGGLGPGGAVSVGGATPANLGLRIVRPMTCVAPSPTKPIGVAAGVAVTAVTCCTV
jgi:hypothetical protein